MGVVKQWAHWGHYPEYMCSDPKLKPLYRSFDKPLLMLSFDDDELACRKGFEDYFNLVGESGNKSAKQQTMIHLKPKSNQTLVGHNGFFLEQNREMWKWVLPWIVEGRQPQSAETIGMSRL